MDETRTEYSQSLILQLEFRILGLRTWVRVKAAIFRSEKRASEDPKTFRSYAFRVYHGKRAKLCGFAAQLHG
jgi:hypothetical protein